MTTIQPVISTLDLARLQRFYEHLPNAVETRRVPEDGPVFFVGLNLGDSELGLVSQAETDLVAPQRILLSVEVDDVNGLLERAQAAGGRFLGRLPACHGDIAWRTSAIPTKTRSISPSRSVSWFKPVYAGCLPTCLPGIVITGPDRPEAHCAAVLGRPAQS